MIIVSVLNFFFPCNLYLGIRQSINGVGDAFGLEMGFNLFFPLSQSMPIVGLFSADFLLILVIFSLIMLWDFLTLI